MEDPSKNSSVRHKENDNIARSLIFFNNDFVFKKIYITIFLKKTMNVITERHRKCGWRQ